MNKLKFYINGFIALIFSFFIVQSSFANSPNPQLNHYVNGRVIALQADDRDGFCHITVKGDGENGKDWEYVYAVFDCSTPLGIRKMNIATVAYVLGLPTSIQIKNDRVEWILTSDE